MPVEIFTTADLVKVTGLTERTIVHYADRKFVVPAYAEAAGTGTRRLYSWQNVVELGIIKAMTRAGLPIQLAVGTVQELAQEGLFGEEKTRYVYYSIILTSAVGGDYRESFIMKAKHSNYLQLKMSTLLRTFLFPTASIDKTLVKIKSSGWMGTYHKMPKKIKDRMTAQAWAPEALMVIDINRIVYHLNKRAREVLGRWGSRG